MPRTQPQAFGRRRVHKRSACTGTSRTHRSSQNLATTAELAARRSRPHRRWLKATWIHSTVRQAAGGCAALIRPTTAGDAMPRTQPQAFGRRRVHKRSACTGTSRTHRSSQNLANTSELAEPRDHSGARSKTLATTSALAESHLDPFDREASRRRMRCAYPPYDRRRRHAANAAASLWAP